MSNKIALVVHGGAGPDSDFIHENEQGYLDGLKAATEAGYAVLERGGSALDAVETAVRTLEDNPLFNAGKGAAITDKGTVQTCASIMNGQDRRSGAVAVVQNVKNPIQLARAVMEKTDVIYLAQNDALEFARQQGFEICPPDYFLTPHAREEWEEEKQKKQEERTKNSGTVGAVACDRKGNIAAATSTGGTPYVREGRIGDSSMIGVGSFADNRTLAASSTGDGEYAIRGVLCYDVACAKEYLQLSARDSCRHVIHQRNKGIEGDLGVISVDVTADIGWAFNSARMHRGWRTEDDAEAQAKIWED